MKRREFIALFGSAAFPWPAAARAQQAGMPVIGWLDPGSPEGGAKLVTAFREGLSEAGYVVGQNVTIEYRWAEGQVERLADLAAELVRRQVVVIAAVDGSASALAAKSVTATVPIVFGIGGDPVALGLVASFNRPSGNITGVSWLNIALEVKRLELLHELVPNAHVIAYLVNPGNPTADGQQKDVESSARALGLQVHALRASTESDIDAAFATIVRQRVGALLVGAGPLLLSRRKQIATLAARHAVPAIYSSRTSVTVGGLMSYASSATDAHRQIGIYTGKILKGAKPADLPVLQPTKFELVISVNAAKALGLAIPQSILLRADEVIE
jgi:putative ABC transport system substrate-binding protein